MRNELPRAVLHGASSGIALGADAVARRGGAQAAEPAR